MTALIYMQDSHTNSGTSWQYQTKDKSENNSKVSKWQISKWQISKWQIRTSTWIKHPGPRRMNFILNYLTLKKSWNTPNPSSKVRLLMWKFALAAVVQLGHRRYVDRCIENQPVIDKILSHFKKKDGLPLLPDAMSVTRVPPLQQ
jgi:hypothetical protein